MAKAVSTAILDLALNGIKTGVSTRMVVLSAQALTYAELTTYKLAEVAMVTGDYTLAAGDVSGRKVTVAAKAAVSITTSGTATHVGLGNGVGLTLDLVTTCTSQAINTGGTVDVGTWKWEINQPT